MSYKRADEDAVTVVVRKVLVDQARALARAGAEVAHARERTSLVDGWRARAAELLCLCAGKLLLGEMRAYDAVIKRETAHGETQMRSLFKFTVALAALLVVPLVAFAQAAASMPVDLSLDEALKQSLPIITSFKGASALAIAVGVTQLVMKLAQSPLGNLAGKWKLIVVTGVSIVATYLGLVAAGTSWLSALIAGPLLAALQVFAHQLITTLKPTPPPEA
ncbi:MAG: hypothetical protein IT381_28170 [Deltaproteobacteria bacterium]|nr:hypothetical protein [Deltaproteobacteria bacterium]